MKVMNESTNFLIVENSFSGKLNRYYKYLATDSYIKAFLELQLYYGVEKECCGFPILLKNYHVSSSVLIALCDGKYELANEYLSECDHQLYWGIVKWSLKLYEESVEILHKVAKDDPKCWLFLVNVYASMNSMDDVIECYKKVLDNTHIVEFIMKRLMSTYLKMGKYEEGISFLLNVKKEEEKAIANILLSKLYYENNDYRKALEQVSSIDDGVYEKCELLGDINFGLGDYEKASECYFKNGLVEKNIKTEIKKIRVDFLIEGSVDMNRLVDAREKMGLFSSDINQAKGLRKVMENEKINFEYISKDFDYPGLVWFDDFPMDILEKTKNLLDILDKKYNLFTDFDGHKIYTQTEYIRLDAKEICDLLLCVGDLSGYLKILDNEQEIFMVRYYRLLCYLCLYDMGMAYYEVYSLLESDAYISMQVYYLSVIINNCFECIEMLKEKFRLHSECPIYWNALMKAYANVNDQDSMVFCKRKYEELIKSS